MQNIECLLDSARGVYVPRDFVEGFDLAKFGIVLSDWEQEVLKDPETEGYWDAWQRVEGEASYTHDNGDVYTLHHDGDLFMVCVDNLTEEEQEQFFC